jgi:hypothetical protein
MKHMLHILPFGATYEARPVSAWPKIVCFLGRILVL